jgi:hypothetical protein
MEKNSGKWFEEKAIDMLQKFYTGLPVHGEKRIKTLYDGHRKIDVGVYNPSNHDYIVFECKDEKHPIGPKALDQAVAIKNYGKGVTKVAVISNSRYTSDTIKYAAHENIDLFNLINPEEKQFRPVLTIPTLHTFIWLAMFEYKCFLFDQDINIKNAPEKVILDNDVNIFDVAKKLWNEKLWESTQGIHEYNYEKFNIAQSIKNGIKRTVPVDNIKFSYEVINKSFLYAAPLVKGEGLYDVRKGLFLSSSPYVSIGPLTIEDVAKLENEIINISDETNISFKGVLVHRL